MKYLGAVSSEGGPLLLADARLARDWRGSDEDGSDYARACDLFAGEERPGGPISIGQGQGIVWDLEDAGTADVFRVETGRIVLVGAWLDEPNDLDAVTALASLPTPEAVAFGSMDIPSGVLAILWSPENGQCIESLDVAESEPPTGEMSIEGTGLLVRVPAGHYVCLHDEVERGDSSAQRCHLVKQ